MKTPKAYIGISFNDIAPPHNYHLEEWHPWLPEFGEWDFITTENAYATPLKMYFYSNIVDITIKVIQDYNLKPIIDARRGRPQYENELF